MRRVWLLVVSVVLLAGLAGCGPPDIEVPEDPAPPPKSDLVSEPTGSAPDAPAESDPQTP